MAVCKFIASHECVQVKFKLCFFFLSQSFMDSALICVDWGHIEAYQIGINFQYYLSWATSYANHKTVYDLWWKSCLMCERSIQSLYYFVQLL